MKKVISILLLLVIMLASGCSGSQIFKSSDKNTEPWKTTIKKPKFTKETYPRIDGSTATIPLSEAIASELLGLSKEEAANFIHHNTTHNAYENLLSGMADIIFVTEPSKEELQMAKDKNIELEVIPIVKEAFVFLVNVKNPINSLESQQIRDIYGGKINNWSKVGGKDIEIIPYQREPNSGSQTLMEQIVMKDTKLMEPPSKLIIAGMGTLIETIAKYDNSEKALGYSVYYYAKSMYNRDTIKLIAVDGVNPDHKSISSGKYPFTSAYYAVIRKSQPPDSSERKLIQWMLSREGQTAAEKAGYVPMGVE